MHPDYDCPRISFEQKEDEQFLCLGEIVILACLPKHAWHSLIFEVLSFFLDMKECMNVFQYIEVWGDNYTLYTKIKYLTDG